MKLHIFGRHNAPHHLVALHGFMSSGTAWAELAERLGETWCVYAPDIAPTSIEEADYDVVCAHIADLIRRIDSEHTAPILLGYSMGGRITLELVRRHPTIPLSALVLESAGLGARSEDEREAYRERSQVWAHRFVSSSPEDYVQWWENLALFESQKTLPSSVRDAQRTARLAVPARVLAATTRGLGQGSMALFDETIAACIHFARRGCRLVYMAGVRDVKYSALAYDFAEKCGVDVQKAGDVRLSGNVGVYMFDAGHNIHMEAPQVFASFLNTVPL